MKWILLINFTIIVVLSLISLGQPCVKEGPPYTILLPVGKMWIPMETHDCLVRK